jgi:hypothetical protein
MEDTGHRFTTIYGRNLVGELANFVHWPYLVVTMEDLWPTFEPYFDGHMAGVHFVKTLELEKLGNVVEALPHCHSVIGLGGGQAIDIAKFIAWSRRLPLFQLPTAMTVNAPFGHRAGIRDKGKVRYMGWAVPEAVYVDFEVIQSAPPSSIGVGSAKFSVTIRPITIGNWLTTLAKPNPNGPTMSVWSPRRARCWPALWPG